MLLFLKLRNVNTYLSNFNKQLVSFEELIEHCKEIYIKLTFVDGLPLHFRGCYFQGDKDKIYINSELETWMQWWTLAHELGHFYLNRHEGLQYFEKEIRAIFDKQANLFALLLFFPNPYMETLEKKYKLEKDIIEKMLDYCSGELGMTIPKDKLPILRINLEKRLMVYNKYSKRHDEKKDGILAYSIPQYQKVYRNGKLYDQYNNSKNQDILLVPY